MIQKPSPNFTKGRNGFKPEAIVIHIMAGTLSGTDGWFSSPTSQVSSHYGIGSNGEVHQYVKEEDTAWHAGGVFNPTWKLIKSRVSPNLYTIGIEHEGFEFTLWTQETISSSAKLIKEICARWSIPLDRQHIIGHYEIKSSKPNCPAINKNIINTLIDLAKGQEELVTVRVPKSKLAKVEQFLSSL